IPTVWHLQGGVATRIPPVQIMCALLSQENVCISHAVERDVRSYLPGLCLPRTCVVYNGLPDQPLQRREGVNRLVSVSRIAPAKGLHHAIDALALVRRSQPDVVLDIVGELSANPGYVRLLQRKVTDCGLTGAVNFVGHVEDVHAVFSRATLTLCPSVEHETLAFDGREQLVQNKEGFCLSAAEA